MSRFELLFDRYPQVGDISWHFTVGILSAGAAAILFRLLVHLCNFPINYFEFNVYSWCVCYTAMLVASVINLNNRLSPFGHTHLLLKAIILSVAGLAPGIFFLWVIGYYMSCCESLFYDLIGLLIPLAGAVFLGYVFENPLRKG